MAFQFSVHEYVSCWSKHSSCFMLPDDLAAPLPGDKAAPPSSQVQPPLKQGAGLPPANKSSDEMCQDPKSKKALDGESMKG